MLQDTTISRLQRITSDAEIAAAVAAGVAEHGIAFSLYVTTVAEEQELVASRLASGFGRRYLGSFTDVAHAHHFLIEQFQEAAAITGNTVPDPDGAIEQALALLQIVENDGTSYAFARPLSGTAPPDLPEP